MKIKIILAVIIVGVFSLGFICGKAHVEEISVKEGRAEYYLDKHNLKQFRWKEVK